MKISRNTEQLLFGLGVAAAAIAGIAIPLIVGTFVPTLRQFAVELPNLTRWFVETRWLFLLLPFVVVAVWFVWPIRAMRSVAALATGVGSLVVLLPLATFAMYYPVMVLGSLV
ncbi:hypothetical protein [Tahibacter soli]|jgi:hypothetical protein|uniref:Uncharacterized protein n=1 Tax=Tahibacter soli TaxID=2983605 RepID=A0A9X3YG17_9GAMM|nr:hypothetical protein [Tahibacter soli]MDC8011424.1 hypothetical protein [Tahibacter soli]